MGGGAAVGHALVLRQGTLGQTADDGGAPLLLLHAWGESWRSFDHFIAMLQPGCGAAAGARATEIQSLTIPPG